VGTPCPHGRLGHGTGCADKGAGGKKIAFVQCAAERRRYFLCIQHGAQESNISPRLLLKGHRIRSVKAVVF
jgi:hypothetical protein